ncbi:MAG TPA: endonuclease/exonuclease/phosphatase family protein, partial [Gaiellaceae bacterium]|nr:endonuclease/exonuclease/phosphatase family protein [Gaiellaceae bacterium]
MTAVFGALTVAGFAGALAWYLDLANHFRVQYALILSVAGLAAALLRSYAVAGPAVALAVTNLAVVAPLGDAEPPEAGPPELTVLVLNLSAGNDDYGAVADLVRRRRPDLFAVAELTPAWARELEGVLEPYESRLLAPRQTPWGLGLYSRRPLSAAATLLPAGSKYPVLAATIAGRTRPIRLVLLHPQVSSSTSVAARHELFFDVAAASVRDAGSRMILGDLNTAPWSDEYDELLGAAAVEDTRAGYGLQTSWPSFLPTILRLPIDHVLVSPDLAASDREVGPEVGSDHLPVWVE